MAIDYTTTALIENVKRRAMVPTSQSTFTPERFCGMLTDEMQSLLVPMIMELSAQYFVYYKDFTIDSTTTIFPLPSRAINQKIKSIDIYNPGDKSYWRPVQVENGQWGFQGINNICATFSIDNDNAVFNVAPTETNCVLRMFYYRRPNNLILTGAAGLITGINTSTNIVSISVNPGFSTSTQIDFIQGSGGFRALGDNILPTSVSGLDLTFATLPDSLAIGDWICPEGESPVAQIPYESQHVLCQAVAIKVLEAQGDQNMIEFSQKKMNELQTHMQSVMKLRVDDQQIHIVNRGGIVDSVRRRNGFFWG